MKSRFVAAVIAVGLVRCTSGGITDNTGNALPENRGSEVQTGVSVGTGGEIAWSADGSEIIFQTGEAQARLMAVPVTGGTARQLDGPRDAYTSIQVAADGSAVYFAADLAAGRRTAYRLPTGGTAQALGPTSAFVPQIPADGGLVLPAPDASGFVWAAAPDTVVHIAGATRTVIGPGCERVVRFSPDSKQVLCQRGVLGSGTYSVANIQAKTVQQIQLVPQAVGTLHMVHWGSAGIRATILNPIGFDLWSFTAQQSTGIWTAPARANLAVDTRHGAWAASGNRLAFWVVECLKLRGLSQCDEGQSILYVVDLGTSTSGYVAVARGVNPGQSLTFSPDGLRIAYVFDGKIYHQSSSIP